MIYDKNGIKVDNTRYMVGGETFPLNSIASVGAWTHNSGSYFYVAVCIVAVLYGAYGIFIPSPDLWDKSGNEMAIAFTKYPAFLFGLVGALIYIPKVKYVVRISTSSGQIDSYNSKDANEIDEIVAAINEAIIGRG